MELKDNFTNRYFKPDLVKSQIDMINQPTEVDAYADAFSKQANREAKGPAQRNSNALMAGFGAGLKGAANAKRQEELSPILKMVGELNARSAYLEAQMQQDEMNKLKIQELFKQNSFNLMNFSKANLAKDTNALNEIAPAFLRNYKQLFGDKAIGAYSHTHDGTIFYENNDTGKIEGSNIAQMIAQSGINPEDIWGNDGLKVMAGLSAGAREKFENTQEMQRLALEKERAGIDQTKAHTGLYDAQAGKAVQELTPEYQQQLRNQKGVDSRSNHNASEFIPKISEQYLKNNEIISSITEFKNILNNTSLTGGSGTAAAFRFIAKQTGNDENVVNAENAGQFYFEWMSDNSKGALSDRDMKRYEKTFASIDKNKDASINILNRLESKLKNQNSIFTKQLEAYEKDPTTNLHSLDILGRKNNTDNTNQGNDNQPKTFNFTPDK